MTENKVRIGVVGCGAFGLFSLQQFIQNPQVEIVMLGGTTREESIRAAERYGIKLVKESNDVLTDKDVDLVYINTPPSLHASQCELALQSGKHVIVEKPLAVDFEDGERLIKLAIEKDLIMVANLMQRYNPVAQRVQEVLASGALGECLYASLENHAVDEGLSTEHWFWNSDISGGIFIEHGVHFFDLANWWLGDLKILSAGQNVTRSDGHVDQVWCDSKTQNGSLCRFYHGFDRTSRLEMQRWVIACELGTLRMEGWIPLDLTVEAIVDNPATKTLTDLLPGYQLNVLDNYGGSSRKTRTHGKWFEVDQKVSITWSPQIDKQSLYCQLLREMLADQLAYYFDRAHVRKITEQNGLESLRLACTATELAKYAC